MKMATCFFFTSASHVRKCLQLRTTSFLYAERNCRRSFGTDNNKNESKMFFHISPRQVNITTCQTTRNDTGKVFLTVSYDHIHFLFGFLVVETGGQALPSLQQNIYNLTMLKASQFQKNLTLPSTFQRTKMMKII